MRPMNCEKVFVPKVNKEIWRLVSLLSGDRQVAKTFWETLPTTCAHLDDRTQQNNTSVICEINKTVVEN